MHERWFKHIESSSQKSSFVAADNLKQLTFIYVPKRSCDSCHFSLKQAVCRFRVCWMEFIVCFIKGQEVRCRVASPVNDSQGSFIPLSIHHSLCCAVLCCAERVMYGAPSQLNDVTQAHPSRIPHIHHPPYLPQICIPPQLQQPTGTWSKVTQTPKKKRNVPSAGKHWIIMQIQPLTTCVVNRP